MSKVSKVKSVFDAVANRYDLMNTLMSLGMQHCWKRKFIKMIESYHTHTLLDVAGGTGDIAMGFLDAGGGHATIGDINSKMIAAGNNQRLDNGLYSIYKNKLNTVCCDAQDLPFAEDMFDRVTISFGIRNVESIQKALDEMFRVLKVGGKFLCMEFIRPESTGLKRQLYDLFSFKCIPAMGKLIIGDSEPYKYLVNSIRTFPKQNDFIKMLHIAGFEMVKITTPLKDVVAIYSCYKL